MNDKKSYKVQIFDEHYVLLSNEPEALVLEAVELVDGLMREISTNGMSLDPKRVAVLSALRIAGQLLEQKTIYHQKNDRVSIIKNYVDHALSSLDSEPK
jgi:cell division protein ZapA (FtsZ GTPase activity inhibitor)